MNEIILLGATLGLTLGLTVSWVEIWCLRWKYSYFFDFMFVCFLGFAFSFCIQTRFQKKKKQKIAKM